MFGILWNTSILKSIWNNYEFSVCKHRSTQKSKSKFPSLIKNGKSKLDNIVNVYIYVLKHPINQCCKLRDGGEPSRKLTAASKWKNESWCFVFARKHFPGCLRSSSAWIRYPWSMCYNQDRCMFAVAFVQTGPSLILTHLGPNPTRRKSLLGYINEKHPLSLPARQEQQ